MLGAIIGDIVGSRFIGKPAATKQFDLLSDNCRFTESTLLTLAVAEAFSHCKIKVDFVLENADEDFDYEYEPDVWFSDALRHTFQTFARRYPAAEQIGRISEMPEDADSCPYKSNYNLAAYASGCAFAANSLEETLRNVDKVAALTFADPKEIHGAKAVASIIFLSRCRVSREYLRFHIEKHYYELPSIYEVRTANWPSDICEDEACLALTAFIDSISFEDAIRNAVLIGRGSSTLAAITGGMAEAFYGISYPLQRKSVRFLPDNLRLILKRYQELFQRPENDRWLTSHYKSYDDKELRDLLSGGPSFFMQTEHYKMIPLHDCDEFDTQRYCESLYDCSDELLDFCPSFKLDLEDALFRFMESWFIVRKSDYHCVGSIEFEKITEDERICYFAITLQPDEEWAEILRPLISFVFEYFNTEKIVVPMNNISEGVKAFYNEIGMTQDNYRCMYETQWGLVPMDVYSFDKDDYLKNEVF